MYICTKKKNWGSAPPNSWTSWPKHKRYVDQKKKNMAPTSRISHSQSLRIAGSVFGTIFIAFGLNAILNPLSALSFFEIYPSPSSSSSSSYSTDQTLIDSLMIIYGARDIFMGLAIYSAAYFGNDEKKDNNNNQKKKQKKNKALGWILIAASAVAFVDGGVCKMMVGKGEWNHWGYAPLMAAVGLALLGGFDRGREWVERRNEGEKRGEKTRKVEKRRGGNKIKGGNEGMARKSDCQITWWRLVLYIMYNIYIHTYVGR